MNEVKPAKDADINGMWVDLGHSTGKLILSLLARIEADRAQIACLEAEVERLSVCRPCYGAGKVEMNHGAFGQTVAPARMRPCHYCHGTGRAR